MPSYEDLEAQIIDSGVCTVCGACILACPNSHSIEKACQDGGIVTSLLMHGVSENTMDGALVVGCLL